MAHQSTVYIRRRMRKPLLCLVSIVVLSSAIGDTPQAQRQAPTTRLKALVGGTLIDGFGGRPIRNSVILIDGERITAVGVQGALAIPAGAEVISTDGMSVLPGPVGHARAPDAQRPQRLRALGQDLSRTQLGPVIMPAGAKQLLLAGVTSARDLGAPLEASIDVREQDQQGRARRARRCTCRARSSSTRRIRAPSCSAGA